MNQMNEIQNDKKNLQNDIDYIEVLITKQRNENKECEESVPQLRRQFEHSKLQHIVVVNLFH